jgi:hypothetical protein
MKSKYKVGQVVTIAEYLESFEISEHRHLTDVMKKAYSDLALIVDVKPAEGILTLIDSKDDGFNYYLKIYRDREYTEKCESEYWTSDLFEECATPEFKINDIVHFTNNDTGIIYRVDSYFKDSDDNGNLAVGYYLVEALNPDNEYYADAAEAKHLELVSVEQVDVTTSSLEKIKSNADIISDYNSHDAELVKQLTQLQQKVEENENRLCKQEKLITRSDRPGELGILNPGNKTRLRIPETILTTISLDSRKRVGFFEN